ncbi:MAG: hypothetical protein ACUVS2_12010 [Candidatus Flexifilum sp.]|jgi:hypothetical protein
MAALAPLSALIAGIGWIGRALVLLLPPEISGFTPAALDALAVILFALLLPGVYALYRAFAAAGRLWLIAGIALALGLAGAALGFALGLPGPDWAGLGAFLTAFGVITAGAAHQAQGFALWRRGAAPGWILLSLSILGLLLIPLIVIPALAGIAYGALWSALALFLLNRPGSGG